jgi:hypothetical protein
MIHSGFAKVSALALLAAGSALADELPSPPRTSPPVLGFFDASKPFCLVRQYDEAHMASRPKQKVTGIAFAYEPFQRIEGDPEAQPMWDQYSDTPAAFVKIVVTFKGEPRPAFGSAECRGGRDARTLICGIEGDGGGFSLYSEPSGRFRLDNPNGFAVAFEAQTDDELDGGMVSVDPKDDHKSFLLDASSGGLCAENWD